MTCPDCNGNGYFDCPACGTADTEECESCDTTGEVDDEEE